MKASWPLNAKRAINCYQSFLGIQGNTLHDNQKHFEGIYVVCYWSYGVEVELY